MKNSLKCGNEKSEGKITVVRLSQNFTTVNVFQNR